MSDKPYDMSKLPAIQSILASGVPEAVFGAVSAELREHERESWDKWVTKARDAWERGQTLVAVHSDLVILITEHLDTVTAERNALREEVKRLKEKR